MLWRDRSFFTVFAGPTVTAAIFFFNDIVDSFFEFFSFSMELLFILVVGEFLFCVHLFLTNY